MAPSRPKLLKASAIDKSQESSFHGQTVTIQSPTRTPSQTSKNIVVGLTQAQKQALIDNLQLEITERARKLRAQYALQAQGLRNRIELRINRIPKSLRTANMGELLMKYQDIKNQSSKTSPLPGRQSSQVETVISTTEVPAAQAPVKKSKESAKSVSARTRGTKRKSDEMESLDKENIPDPMQIIPNPKKRTKSITGTVSQKASNQSTVLSPKSSNSRAIPHPPMHPPNGSPQKPYPSCLPSPLKPVVMIKLSSPAKSAAIANTNPVNAVSEKIKAVRTKKPATRKASNPAGKPKSVATRPKHGVDNTLVQNRSVSNTSQASTVSTGTTIMKKGAKSTVFATAAASKKNNLNTGTRAAGRKAAAVPEIPPTGRRVLRKRV